jgi:hypothetical protein
VTKQAELAAAGGGVSEIEDPGCRPSKHFMHGYLGLPTAHSPFHSHFLSHFLSHSRLFTSSPRPRREKNKRKQEKMEALPHEDQLNARRKAVVLNGFPLLALSFQTLGISRFLPSPTILRSHGGFRDYLFRYWHCQHCRLPKRLQVPLMSYSSLPSTCSMVSGQPPLPLRTLLVV